MVILVGLLFYKADAIESRPVIRLDPINRGSVLYALLTLLQALKQSPKKRTGQFPYSIESRVTSGFQGCLDLQYDPIPTGKAAHSIRHKYQNPLKLLDILFGSLSP